jgi:hypothetical protein
VVRLFSSATSKEWDLGSGFWFLGFWILDSGGPLRPLLNHHRPLLDTPARTRLKFC